MDRLLRVLIIDDSAYVRKVMKQMLSRSPFIEVVGGARDGREALEMVEALNPDVVTCDLTMPRLDGLGFIREQFRRRPLPVIVVSIASQAGELALAALDAGALDFVQKPTALATDRIFEVGDELVEKVKMAGSVAATHLRGPDAPVSQSPARNSASRTGRVDVVVLGISTGGPQALKILVPRLPADLCVPIAVVLHMPPGYTGLYASRLDQISRLKVVEAKDKQAVEPGMLLLAPAGRHMSFRRGTNGKVFTHLDARPFDTPHRPAADVLFQSAAEVFGSRVLGVVMTGMGCDGKRGAAWIKAQGGLVFTESDETCVVYGMPASVIEAGLSDRTVPLDKMADAILEVL